MWLAHIGSKATEPSREYSQCAYNSTVDVSKRAAAEEAAQPIKRKEGLASTTLLSACLYSSWAKDQPDVFSLAQTTKIPLG